VIQELGEDGLSDIHPSLLTIGAAINFKSKNESYTLSRVICDRYSERPDFSRTLLNAGIDCSDLWMMSGQEWPIFERAAFSW
jgi:hypothetical protein